MSFTVYENDAFMCSGENVLICDLLSDRVDCLSLPKLTVDDKQRHHNNADIDTYHGITTIFVSNDGEYFCVCTNRKQLCLYERSSRNLVSNRTLVRAASRARFTPTNDVIVADKSGDLYLYETKGGSEGKLILGHLSMLLDCLVTKDNKCVVTTDRDEKIRVSCFPNGYNIVSYCLGHEKFVTAVAQFPQNDDILLSAGGDGKIRAWDYLRGEEIASYAFNEKIPDGELDTLNESLKCFELTESVDTLPVKHLRMEKLHTETVLVLSFYSSKRILVYFASNDCKLSYSETIVLDNEPLECCLKDENMWILDDKSLRLYVLREKKFELHQKVNERLAGVNERWAALRKSANKQSIFPILYKRKFDNVQEYKERKRSRLGI